ncbi:hypothetical protein EG329_002167 [Mollisiaceae sp. DMI_Dod_QoI]|nr:hypothetical protein EG329_002167 [Helotiales sp. DMI_Dod_QoI]
MKNKQASLSQVRTPYYETNTSQASRTDSPGPRNGVPRGTVASRVQFLQSLETTTNTRPNPSSAPAPPTSNRRRENSRTGFGRRLTNRFGPPALQSAQPFEEARVDTSHSFLGLNTPRKSHVEEHGVADNRVRYSKSPGINGTIARVTGERVQFDAVAPWGGLSRSKSSRSMGRKRDNDSHMSDRLTSHGHVAAEATKFFPSSHEDHSSTFRRHMRSHEADTLKSESSFATTSTIRRQSVRDLFEDYGIETPEGLAPSKEPPHNIEDTPRPHRFCHVCSWANSGPSTKCWRCNHQLCEICDAQSPQPMTLGEPSLRYSERFSKVKAAIDVKQNGAVDFEPIKRVPIRPKPSPIQTIEEEEVLRPRKRSSPLMKFPDYHPELSPAIKPSQASHPPKTVQEVHRNVVSSGVPGAQGTTSVRESPFLIADSTAKKQSITLFPFDTRADRHQRLSSHHRHHLRQQNQRSSHSTSSSRSFRCEMTGCQSTHDENRSHQHEVSRAKGKEKHCIREETEYGYAADTSLAEDDLCNRFHSHTQSSQQPSQARSAFSKQQTHLSEDTHHTHDHRQETTYESYIPEFVECHGYPRTGHVRHGSSSGAELVGECQHCAEDCQCIACQGTHHNVRCCTHKDHKAIVHQHHTPQKEISPVDPHVRPLSTPRKASVPSRSLTATPPRSQSANVDPLPIRSSTRNNPPKKILSRRASMERVPSITLTKRSTFIKEASKPPTPPPWVSLPRSSLLKPPRYAPIDNVHDQDIPDPFASLRKSPTLPASNICKESNLSLRNEQSERRWSSAYAENRDHAQDRYTMLSRKCSTIREKQTPLARNETRSSSQIKVSPPGSRRVSRRLSALLQLREQDSVPALTKTLTKTLLQHQEELRDTWKNTEQRIEAAPPGGVASLTRNLENREGLSKRETKEPDPAMQKSKTLSRAASTESTKRWRLRLIDKKANPPCPNDKRKVLNEHRLEDDELLERNIQTQDRKVMSEGRLDIQKKNIDEHECRWKRMAVEIQNGSNGRCSHKEEDSLGIKGVTIILHFDHRENMVLKAGFWTTTGEPGVLS